VKFLGLADVVDLAQYRPQREASNQSFDAVTLEEHEAAHVAMRRAFPLLAREFPCRCAPCRKAGLA
jgi:hypothetical protein